MIIGDIETEIIVLGVVLIILGKMAINDILSKLGK